MVAQLVPVKGQASRAAPKTPSHLPVPTYAINPDRLYRTRASTLLWAHGPRLLPLTTA